MQSDDGDDDDLRRTVVRWLERVIIDLSLCPFAAAPHQRGAVRTAVCRAGDEASALLALWEEIQHLLRGGDGTETTLLLLPGGWSAFDDLLDLCAMGEGLLERTGLDDQIQLVAFHPAFCFAEADEDDPGNLVNRSPVPLIHLLRTEDVSQAVDTHPDIEGIPERNAARLRALGAAAVQARWAGADLRGSGR